MEVMKFLRIGDGSRKEVAYIAKIVQIASQVILKFQVELLQLQVIEELVVMRRQKIFVLNETIQAVGILRERDQVRLGQVGDSKVRGQRANVPGI